MSDLNKCFFTGNLGKDPDMFTTESGKKISKFSLAVNEYYYTSTHEKQEKTTWINVVCFDSQAEFCYQYLQKGAKVTIEGKLQFRKYLAKDQTERTVTEIIAQNVVSGGRNPRPENDDGGTDSNYNSDPLADFDKPAEASSGRKGPEQEDMFGGPITDDDIPF